MNKVGRFGTEMTNGGELDDGVETIGQRDEGGGGKSRGGDNGKRAKRCCAANRGRKHGIFE